MKYKRMYMKKMIQYVMLGSFFLITCTSLCTSYQLCKRAEDVELYEQITYLLGTDPITFQINNKTVHWYRSSTTLHNLGTATVDGVAYIGVVLLNGSINSINNATRHLTYGIYNKHQIDALHAHNIAPTEVTVIANFNEAIGQAQAAGLLLPDVILNLASSTLIGIALHSSDSENKK